MKNAPTNFKLETSDYKDIVKSLVIRYRELIIPLPLFFHHLVVRGFKKEEVWDIIKKLQRDGHIYKSKNFIVVICGE
jgi:hypothetical protein